MAYVMLIVGLCMAAIGYQGKHEEFLALIKDDFAGPNNFLIWIVAIGIVGAMGYIKPIRPIANSLLLLLILVLFLSNGGFFNQLNATIQKVTK